MLIAIGENTQNNARAMRLPGNRDGGSILWVQLIQYRMIDTMKFLVTGFQ